MKQGIFRKRPPTRTREQVDQHRFVRRGRLLVVDGENWRWRCGRGGTVVAYSEAGERRQSTAWTIKGVNDPEGFARGQWKRTSDGMLKPAEVTAWILSTNAKGDVQ